MKEPFETCSFCHRQALLVVEARADRDAALKELVDQRAENAKLRAELKKATQRKAA